jgi:IS1 family transposase
MNRMDTARRAQVIRCLIEGNSINSTVRMTGVAKNTVLKLLVEIGSACSAFLDEKMRNLNCQRLQADEAWSFCYCKQRNLTPEIAEDRTAGDVWAWVAIDADTKIIPTWRLGRRDWETATEFIQDLAGRLANRVQLTTDGLKVYVSAVLGAFGGTSTIRSFTKSMQQRQPEKHDTARRNASAVNVSAWWAVPIPVTSAQAISNGRT